MSTMDPPRIYSPLYSFKSTRFWICILLATGLYSTVSMRLNLSMAVTCMVNSTAFIVQENDEQYSPANRSNVQQNDLNCPNLYSSQEAAAEAGYNGDLLWSPPMQSLLFSATFYGGLATISFSGYMADRFGPKIILLTVAADYIIVSWLTPILAKWSFGAFFASRMIMGIGEGFNFPTIASMAGRWFAPEERSTVAAMYTSGNQIASALTSYLASRLCGSSWGWPAIFYLFGMLGVIWCIIFYIFASNYPSNNKWISQEERIYLSVHVPHRKGQRNMVPWRKMFTSHVLWCIVFCQFSFNMQATMMQAFLPTYLKEQIMLPLDKNGFYTMIPFIAQLISKNVFGVVADYLKRNHILGHTTCAKLFQAIGSMGSGTMMLLLAILPNCHRHELTAVLLGIYGALFSVGICGFFTSLMCIAPEHSGTLTSIAMVFGTLGNLTSPLVLSFVQYLNLTIMSRWTFMFLICSIMSYLSGTYFLLCGSAERQLDWVTPKVPLDKVNPLNIWVEHEKTGSEVRRE